MNKSENTIDTTIESLYIEHQSGVLGDIIEEIYNNKGDNYEESYYLSKSNPVLN